MIQWHEMIFWAKPRYQDFDDIVKQGYNILLELKRFGDDLSPNYLPAYRKKDVKAYNLEYSSFEQLLREGVNNIFHDMGYRVAFFSSLDDDKSSGVSLHLGATHKTSTNCVVIDFPNYYDLTVINDKREKVTELFKNICGIFNPYWAAMINGVNSKRYDSLWKNDLPGSVHWINYWGEDVINIVGDDKINNVSLHYKEQICDGYCFKIKETPIDNECEDDIKLQSQLNSQFGLPKIL